MPAQWEIFARALVCNFQGKVMRGWKRVLPYLLLNVLISAGVTWGALSLWARLHPCPAAFPPAPEAQGPLTAPNGEATPTPAVFVYVVQAGETLSSIAEHFGVSEETLRRLNRLQGDALRIGQTLLIPGTPPPASAGDPQALHVTVLGGGYLAEERVRLRYDGPGALDLTGWHLEDDQGHVFVFPALRLQSEGAVEVWSKKGEVNTAVALFWGLEQALWHSGAQLTLRDAEGRVVLQYRVP